MESPFSTLGFVIFGLWISIYAIVVESDRAHVVSESSSLTSAPSSSPSSALPPAKLKDSKDKRPPRRQPPLQQPHPPLLPPLPPPLLPPLPPPSPPPHLNASVTKSHQMNEGKKLGLFFLGMAGLMQIGVVVFLVFKRRQLLKTKDRYETGEKEIGCYASDSGKNVEKKYVTSGMVET